MKKQFVFVAIALYFGIATASAQGGGQRMTPEERTKSTMEKLAVLNLDADARAKTEAVIADFYSSQQKAMQDMRATGSMNRDSMMVKRKGLADARDAKLKAIFTPEQMKKWTDEIEPSLRPQRAGGERPPQ